MTPTPAPHRSFLTPRGASWLGAALIVVGGCAHWLISLASVFREQQNQAALDAIWWLMTTLQMLIPLGVGLLALSIVARAVVGTETHEAEAEEREDENKPSLRVFSARAVLIAGLVLAAAGLALTTYLDSWRFDVSGNPGLAQDFVLYIAPILQPALFPLGILLIPCAWVLRLLESRSALSAIH